MQEFIKRKFSHLKLTVAGDILEFNGYERPICINPPRHSHSPYLIIEKGPNERIASRQSSIKRAIKKVKAIINSNVRINDNDAIPKFLTLTFKENIQNIPEANYEFTKFKQRLDYELTGSKKGYLKYLTVIQFQKRGSIHYHSLFFNLPYFDNNRLAELWGQGYLKINKIDNVKNIGSYVCGNYMTKKIDDEKLIGQKCYFTSRNLKKPIITRDEKTISEVLSLIPQESLVFDKSFPHKYFKHKHIRIYNLKDNPQIHKTALALIG